jgi:hypothetical protein
MDPRIKKLIDIFEANGWAYTGSMPKNTYIRLSKILFALPIASERRFPGYGLPVSIIENRSAAIDKANVHLVSCCFFKNVTVFSKTWDELLETVGRLVIFPRKHAGFWDGLRKMA